MSDSVFAPDEWMCYNFSMLDLNFIRENLDVIKKKTEAKGVEFNTEFFQEIDKQRREYISESEGLRSQKKKIVKKIGDLKRNNENTQEMEKEASFISTKINDIANKLTSVEEKFHKLLLEIPNIFDDSVPEGRDESENLVIREWA